MSAEPERVETAPSVAEERTTAFAKGLLEVFQMLAMAVVISIALNVFVVQVTEVRQRSMEPTLLSSDRVLVSKVDYRLHPPQHDDIIVFRPVVETNIPFVKRVIALAGETVDIKDGRVLVNGRPLDEPYVNGRTTERNPQQIHFPLTVPPNSVFVLGDNRPVSGDSREWGAVPDENIIGKVVVRFWPATTAHFFAW